MIENGNAAESGGNKREDRKSEVKYITVPARYYLDLFARNHPFLFPLYLCIRGETVQALWQVDNAEELRSVMWNPQVYRCGVESAAYVRGNVYIDIAAGAEIAIRKDLFPQRRHGECLNWYETEQLCELRLDLLGKGELESMYRSAA